MKIFGHRGASGTAPENTLQAFRSALAAGAAGVELDAQATADGAIVVIHDQDLSRTTSGRGSVREVTLSQLRALDAGAGEPVPTLDAVLAMLAGRMTIDIEIKQPGIEHAVLAVLAGHPAATWFISCFDWDVLRRVKQIEPDAPVWPLAMTADDALFAVAEELAAPGIALHRLAYQPEVAARIRRAERKVGIWTVNDPAEARLVRDLGADILMTDFPEQMMIALRER